MEPEKNIEPVSQSAESQETIFSEVYDLTPYEKSMRNARIWLYVITGFQVGMGIYEYNTIPDQKIATLALAIDVGIGLVFLALALWSRKKPVAAFTTALVFYILIHVSFAILSGEAADIARGIIIKVFIIIALVKANRDARKYEEIRASIGKPV